MEDTALATVGDETSLTLGVPAEMTTDELHDVVIQAFAKIRPYIPYIIELRRRFEDADRDELNRLRKPIQGCHSWKEYCKSILNRTPRTVWDACRDKKPKQLPAVIPVSDADVAEYEQEHPAVRQFTQKLMAQMSPDDAASVLVNAFEKDQPPMSKQMAEAIVRIVSAEMAAAQPLKNPALGAVVSRAAKARELTSLLGLEVQPDAGKLFNLLHITEEQIRAIAATGCLKDYEYVEPV